jgi:hypothetical protein
VAATVRKVERRKGVVVAANHGWVGHASQTRLPKLAVAEERSIHVEPHVQSEEAGVLELGLNLKIHGRKCGGDLHSVAQRSTLGKEGVDRNPYKMLELESGVHDALGVEGAGTVAVVVLARAHSPEGQTSQMHF